MIGLSAIIKRAAALRDLRKQAAASQVAAGASSSDDKGTSFAPAVVKSGDERTYTLHEALEIFVKGAQLAVAEKEAAAHANREATSVDEQATIHARDLLKAAAALNAESPY